MQYTVIYQKEPEGGYTAYVPLLSGCITYGATLDESKKQVQEAIELYIDSLQAHNEEVPREEDTFISHINVDVSSRGMENDSFMYA